MKMMKIGLLLSNADMGFKVLHQLFGVFPKQLMKNFERQSLENS
jgi:hypothetical protein